MFGKHLWPATGTATHSYDQVRAACWYFNDTNHVCGLSSARADPRGRAQQIRFSTRWLAQYADREITDVESRAKIKAVYHLVHEISFAMENEPEGECNYPMHPTAEGRW
jgi:hypothetical protein